MYTADECVFLHALSSLSGHPIVATYAHSCVQLIDQLVALAKADSLEVNEPELRKRASRYSLEDLERVVDAFERFGAKNIFRSF